MPSVFLWSKEAEGVLMTMAGTKHKCCILNCRSHYTDQESKAEGRLAEVVQILCASAAGFYSSVPSAPSPYLLRPPPPSRRPSPHPHPHPPNNDGEGSGRLLNPVVQRNECLDRPARAAKPPFYFAGSPSSSRPQPRPRRCPWPFPSGVPSSQL